MGKLNVGNPDTDIDTNILDIEIPPEMLITVPTGMDKIDALMADGGFTPGMLNFVTGLPGYGKSQLMMTLADSIVSTGNSCNYNGNEESMYQLRKTATRLDLKNGFNPSAISDLEEYMVYLDTLTSRNKSEGKHTFFVVDSLQTMEIQQKGAGRPMGPLGISVKATWELAAFCKKNFAIGFVIGMVNKNGEPAGKREVQHIIDCHLHLCLEKDKDSPVYGFKIIDVMKNRFGPAGWSVPYKLESSGFTFIDL